MLQIKYRMKKHLFLLIFCLPFYSYAQGMHTIDTKISKLITDGWHKFDLEGAYYDVKVSKHRFVKGNIKWKDGSTYSGSLGSSGIHGKGTYTWPNGLRYEGAVKNNKRHGKGTIYLKNGTKFSGKWKENKKHGKGKLFDANGNVIKSGVWENGILLEDK